MAMVDLDGDGCLSMREVDEGVRECREVDTLVAGGTGAGERGQAQELTGHVHRMQGQPGGGLAGGVLCVVQTAGGSVYQLRLPRFRTVVAGIWPILPACLPAFLMISTTTRVVFWWMILRVCLLDVKVSLPASLFRQPATAASCKWASLASFIVVEA